LYLVVFGQSLTPTRCPGLDLPGTKSNYQVSNKGVLGLTRPVGNLGRRGLGGGEEGD